MLTITVAQDGSGDFASVSEAVLAVPYACAAEICIGPGVYREKLVCEKQDITLIGAGMESTRIVWGDGGRLPHPDGRPTHTFRSYTAFFRGTELRVQDLTIENDAGPGAKVGQAVAAYVDCSHTLFENVRLLGNQDTLFCAPLPEKEREKDGFLGPGRFAPRRPTAQYYRHCEIAGDIDFIFGGADALFEQCTIRTVNNHLLQATSRLPRAVPMASGLCSGTATLFRMTARRARCFWAGHGGPPERLPCWTAVWEPTLHRKAFRLGRAAPTRTWPALRKRAAPARAQQRAVHG